MWRFVVYSLRLRRVQYRVAELPIFLIPVLLTCNDASAFLSAAFWEGLLIFLFLFAFGDLVNCLADRDLDAIYKPHLTEAVHGLGIRGVVAQSVFSAVLALALAVHLAWLLDRWLLVPAVAVGLFVAYAYSVEPFRLKGRGLWQLAFDWLGLFTGPMLFAALLFTPWPDAGVIAVALAYGLMQTGVMVVNAGEDLPEDRQMGVRTIIVAVGLQRGLGLAVLFTVAGGLGLLGAFGWLAAERNATGWALAALVPLAVACALVSGDQVRLWRRTARVGEEEAIQLTKRTARRVPLWITGLALTSLLASVGLWWDSRTGEHELAKLTLPSQRIL